LFVDFYESFIHYWNSQIYGDLVPLTLPSKDYGAVFNDPFGFGVLSTGERIAGSNRFFASYITYLYFNNVPLGLQVLGISPIDSIYYASAIIKIITHIGIVVILGKWVVGRKQIWSTEGLMAMVFATSFFLVAWVPNMNFKDILTVIDKAPAYTIFYAFALWLVMIYFHPFLQMLWGNRSAKFSIPLHLTLLLLAVIISFNGPINSPTILLFCSVILGGLFVQNIKKATAPSFVAKIREAIQQIPKVLLFHFCWIMFLGLYSYYLGTYNLENPVDAPSLLERYLLLIKGVARNYVLGHTYLSPLLILILFNFVNVILIYRQYQGEQAKKILNSVLIFVVFASIYVLLLPLGGYRPYRPWIVRYDVVLPINLGLIFFFIKTSFFLFKHMERKKRLYYAVPLGGLIALFTIVDRIPYAQDNKCEYKALTIFATSAEKIVELPSCNVLSWEVHTDPKKTYMQSKLLYRWNVIDKEEKRFFAQPVEE